MNDTYGQMNAHAISRILKETVSRAMKAIQNARDTFDIQPKMGYTGKVDDMFTTADTNAQEVYLKAFLECFPGYGVIGEENSLRIAASVEFEGLYFTVDPLDGTKAFIRGQSHGIGTMVALVHRGTVIAAYVGDVNTGEVYGYRPNSNRVHRITRFDTVKWLGLEGRKPIIECHALLRNPADRYSALTQKTLQGFKNYEVTGSSIGIWLAQLWKEEVGAVFMEPGTETPWDSTPIIGISKKLGYEYLRPNSENTGWVEYEPIIPLEVYHRDHDTLIVHHSHLHEFLR